VTDSVDPMRRTLPTVVVATLLLAACGSDGDGSATAETTADAADDATADTGADDDTAADDGTTPAETDAQPTETTPADEPEEDYPDKPDVEIPEEIPAELESRTLIEGTGPPAVPGDTVIVDYVGVRTVDGVEFDASYDRQTPLAVTLGSGGVIDGWDQGLEGVQSGQRIQLDIPSELAYGAEARSDVIGADEALTFVIDVRAVISSDPADAPEDAGVPESVGATEVTTVDLVEGDGEALELGDTAVINFVLFRADNLIALDSTWDTEPIQIIIDEGGFPGLVKGVPGMKVGGRRAITIPPEDGFGPTGDPQMGLPGDTDIVIVVDLLGLY
jgi:peptidylprolyl isomerase